MRRAAILLSLIAFCAGPSAVAKHRQEVLPAAKIANVKKLPCTFLHVWATWCTICIQELPSLLKTLAAMKGVNPVIIDVSAGFVQNNFSKKWMANLAPPFTTYLKPDGNDEKYLAAIDKRWSGALPYTALYHKGKQVKTWIGELDQKKMVAEIPKLCTK